MWSRWSSASAIAKPCAHPCRGTPTIIFRAGRDAWPCRASRVSQNADIQFFILRLRRVPGPVRLVGEVSCGWPVCSLGLSGGAKSAACQALSCGSSTWAHFCGLTKIGFATEVKLHSRKRKVFGRATRISYSRTTTHCQHGLLNRSRKSFSKYITEHLHSGCHWHFLRE